MTTAKPRGKVTLEPPWLSAIWQQFPGNDLSGKLRWAIHQQLQQTGYKCPADCPLCGSPEDDTEDLFASED